METALIFKTNSIDVPSNKIMPFIHDKEFRKCFVFREDQTRTFFYNVEYDGKLIGQYMLHWGRSAPRGYLRLRLFRKDSTATDLYEVFLCKNKKRPYSCDITGVRFSTFKSIETLVCGILKRDQELER